MSSAARRCTNYPFHRRRTNDKVVACDKGIYPLSRPAWFDEFWSPLHQVVFYPGDCLGLLSQIPDQTIQLVVTSPPYNIGKPYETKKSITSYVIEQSAVIKECVRVLRPGGSICWEVGNLILPGSSILPLDILLYP